MARANHEREIAVAVARSFLSAGFSTADLLTGQIVHTDLPWQCPALKCEDTLNKIPFETYLNYPIGIDQVELLKFWKSGLKSLYSSVRSTVNPQGWLYSRHAIPGASAGERSLRFSIPDGYPNHNDMAGFVFTLEVANLLACSGDIKNLVSTPDSYYVITREEETVGIIDGLISTDSPWEGSVAGMVETLLLSPRGQPVTDCRYDLLAKIRSVLYENETIFEEFTGLDAALQTLAKLSQGKLCNDLLVAIQGMVPDNFEMKRKIKTLDEAVEMLDGWVVNDRVKIFSLYELLVPAVLSVTGFHSKVYDTNRQVPAILRDDKLKKIRANLLGYRENLLGQISARDRKAMEK